MRKSLLAVASLLLLGAAACKKEYYTTNPNSNTVVNTTVATPTYRIDGIQDVTLQKVDSGVALNSTGLFLAVQYGNKNQERLRLSLEGKPTGVRDSFTVSTGYPNFTSFRQLSDSGVAAGNYPLKLVMTGDSSGRREFAFDLKVVLPRACSGDLVDTGYNAMSACASMGTYRTAVQATGVRNQIRIINVDGAGGSLIANLNCGLGTVTVPPQTVNGVAYSSGTGTFSVGIQKNIDFTVNVSLGGGGSTVCSVSMSR